MDDNCLLKLAIGLCSEVDTYEVIPVYSFLPGIFGLNDPDEVSNFTKFRHKRSILNTNFILESVKELKSKLKDIGSDLLITMLEPHEFIQKLLREDRTNVIIIDREIAYEERQSEKKIIKMAFENNAKICKTW